MSPTCDASSAWLPFMLRLWYNDIRRTSYAAERRSARSSVTPTRDSVGFRPTDH